MPCGLPSPDLLPEWLFHTTDICNTAVIKRCTKAYDKDFVISDIILI